MAKSLDEQRKHSLGTIPSIEGSTRLSLSFGASRKRTWTDEDLRKIVAQASSEPDPS